MKMISVNFNELVDAIESIEEDITIQIQRDGRHWRVSRNAPIAVRRVQHYDHRGMPVDNGPAAQFAVEIVTVGDTVTDATVLEVREAV